MPPKTKPEPEPADYPVIQFRPTPILARRIQRLSEESGQSVSAIVRECLSAHLSVLESAQKEAA